MIQVITQAAIEAIKATLMAVTEPKTLVSSARPLQATLRMNGPTLKKPTFTGNLQISTMNCVILK